MKLVATALAVSLSMFGCATDNDGEGGAYLDGLRPAKPSIDDRENTLTTLNPAIDFILNNGVWMELKGGTIRTPDGGTVSAEDISVPFPIQGLCKACQVIALRDDRLPEEINLIDDYGHFLCRLWVEPGTGRLVSTDCR